MRSPQNKTKYHNELFISLQGKFRIEIICQIIIFANFEC